MSSPSNAPEGYPTHQNGYPLMYPINGEGKVVGNPRLIYDSQTFKNVREIMDYKVAVLRRDAELENWQENVNVKGKGFPEFTKEKTDEILRVYDEAMAAERPDLAYYQFTSDEEFALRNRGWTRQQTAEPINKYYTGPAPEGWEGSNQQAYRSK